MSFNKTFYCPIKCAIWMLTNFWAKHGALKTEQICSLHNDGCVIRKCKDCYARAGLIYLSDHNHMKCVYEVGGPTVIATTVCMYLQIPTLGPSWSSVACFLCLKVLNINQMWLIKTWIMTYDRRWVITDGMKMFELKNLLPIHPHQLAVVSPPGHLRLAMIIQIINEKERI